VKFVPVDVGSWIQGAGDGKEARWTEQLVNLLCQIAVAVAKGYDGLQVDQATRMKQLLPSVWQTMARATSHGLAGTPSTNKPAEILDGAEYLRS
jgi:hypothetical protein